MDEYIQALDELLSGKTPSKIDTTKIPNGDKRDLAARVNSLIDCMEEIQAFILPLSKGILEGIQIKPSNVLASPFKALHSSLMHLTWQAGEVAKGDYSQRVDFMGEFSEAFNSMVISLKRHDELLREKIDELGKINRELDDFTYIVSHDLKEPLRSIEAFSSFLWDDYKDKLQGEASDYLERIKASVARMQRLIDDLLKVSRIERTKGTMEEADFAVILADVQLRLEYSIKNKNVELSIVGPLPIINCDRVRITEVFHNLISNAIKYNDKPRPVVEVGCSRKGEFWECYVKDNGQGIDERYHGKIFEMFQRLESKGIAEGTGAGLAIVKKIIEIHGGTIWIVSKPGEGAAFYFTLPAAS